MSASAISSPLLDVGLNRRRLIATSFTGARRFARPHTVGLSLPLFCNAYATLMPRLTSGSIFDCHSCPSGSLLFCQRHISGPTAGIVLTGDILSSIGAPGNVYLCTLGTASISSSSALIFGSSLGLFSTGGNIGNSNPTQNILTIAPSLMVESTGDVYVSASSAVAIVSNSSAANLYVNDFPGDITVTGSLTAIGTVALQSGANIILNNNIGHAPKLVEN